MQENKEGKESVWLRCIQGLSPEVTDWGPRQEHVCTAQSHATVPGEQWTAKHT